MITDLASLGLKAPDKNSQAYNQADNYLLQQLSVHYQGESLAIVNDNFGALTLALKAINPSSYNDSAIFRNHLQHAASSLDQFKLFSIQELAISTEEVFLIQLPKNLHLFQYQLTLIAEKKPKLVIVAGMQKYWPKSFYDVAREYFTDCQILPGVKKAKCMLLRQPKTSTPSFEVVKKLRLPEFGLQLHNYPHVFSRDKLDIGSRFLLENLPSFEQENTLLDLACGNGVLGLYAQLQNPHLFAHYVDESQLAIASCQASLSSNEIETQRYQLHHNDSLDNLAIKDIDVVLCNPPFHQGHRVSENIAIKMIQQASQCLAANGQLLLVANRHLAYYAPLKRHFASVDVLASNSKFTIYQAKKK